MNISEKVNSASKWSLITELLSKLVSPVMNMILARLLAPEAFGMVATITMVTSFADIFTDAGFQKFLVQGEFKDDNELDKSTNVAFWTNFSISMIAWVLIVTFRHQLAMAVGNQGLGNALAIAACTIPLTSFSSIQMARYRRDFDFRTLFFAKLLGVFIPLCITVPLAFALRSFWALVIGNLAIQLANAVLLTVRSKWKPKFFYSLKIAKDMFGFSLWTLLEQLLGWVNLNIGIFLVGKFLSEYYLGVYKTSMATSNQVMSIIVNAFSPVILATLSRLKGDDNEFKNMFYKFEERISFIIIPLGVGIFVFRDLVTKILLGGQWMEAAPFIGIWGLMRALLIVFGMFSMEVFVSTGRPKFSVLSQILELAVLLPTLLITAPKGYDILYIARSMVVLWSIIVELTLLKRVAGIMPLKIVRVCLPHIGAAIIMGGVGYGMLNISDRLDWQIVSVAICILVYFGLLFMIPKSRETMKAVIEMITSR